MALVKDISGIRSGRLLVIEFVYIKDRNAIWKCICDCGNEVQVKSAKLSNGHVRSCGCLQIEHARALGLANQSKAARARLRHGHARRTTVGISPTWNTWSCMRNRCEDPKSPSYINYGARGISVCDRWQSFDLFLADMGERPKGKFIDRIDSDGNYEPGNCRWATRLENNRNRRGVRPELRSL